MKFTLVEWSSEVISLADGLTTSRWAVAEIRDAKRKGLNVKARAELIGKGAQMRAVITSLEFGSGGRPVLPLHVNALAKLMPDLPAIILDLATMPKPHKRSDDRAFIRALLKTIRNPNLTQFEREDEVLTRWESEFAPQGVTQRDAAERMGLTHSSFRTYLAHARARRGNK